LPSLESSFIRQALNHCGIEINQRAEALPLPAFICLSAALSASA
jgi:hypothetical protein